ncbi:hypothetical protein BS47DRAFT_1146773 [Hydnum rufescens UP504]|uniref:Uncharacterized protein n=1 Tax=Hydnum rufescens UP504 TaxID=1448309 RepID=A0A9P6ATI8_9AGAM|nr:hypothetical protein BS47DRAFT_1146773 [Hydnum rufescens UP504]
MLTLPSPSDPKRPRRGRRSAPDDHHRTAPPDVDIDHVASLVLNVSQSLRERAVGISDPQSSKFKECSASAICLPTNTPRLHDNLLDMTNETDVSLNARGNHRVSQSSQSAGPQSRIDSMDIYQDILNSHPHPSNLPSQHQSISMEKASSSRRILSSSQLGRASSLTAPRLSARERPSVPSENAGQYGHSSVAAVAAKKLHNLSPPSRPHTKLLSSSVKSKSLGMKGMPKSGLITAGAAKPFKVPLVSSRAQAIVSVPATTQRGVPPAQPPSIDVLANTSSSSDSFEMDSFGPDLEAVEACLQKFD